MITKLIREDITEVAADAIVNAANNSLLGGGGVDGSIHRKGGKAILDECMDIRRRQGGCATGEAVITTAGNLPAKYVIHTVGPVWYADTVETRALLHNCYTNALTLAVKYGLRSIAFPNISTGIYHYPKDIAAAIAIDAVNSFPQRAQIEEVIFVCYDEENYRLYQKLLQS